MPNWTSNRIYAEGDEIDLRAFLEAVKWQDTILDFNRIIPMPEILKHTGSGHRTIAGQTVTSWYVIDPAEPLSNDDGVRLFTPEEEAALADIGHRDWYAWCNANWGTKWNAAYAEIEDEGSVPYGGVAITFLTAWVAPDPIFHRLGKLFPKLTFTFEWRHEDESLYPHSLVIEAQAA